MYKGLFDNCFLFFKTKYQENMFDKKLFFIFLFLIFKNKNKVFLNNIFYLFYIVFNYFLNIILKNNYTNI